MHCCRKKTKVNRCICVYVIVCCPIGMRIYSCAYALQNNQRLQVFVLLYCAVEFNSEFTLSFAVLTRIRARCVAKGKRWRRFQEFWVVVAKCHKLSNAVLRGAACGIWRCCVVSGSICVIMCKRHCLPMLMQTQLFTYVRGNNCGSVKYTSASTSTITERLNI